MISIAAVTCFSHHFEAVLSSDLIASSNHLKAAQSWGRVDDRTGALSAVVRGKSFGILI
jgi:hypothetical protein